VIGTGSWGVAFGVASAVFAILDSVDLDSGIDAVAQSSVYIRYVHDGQATPPVHLEVPIGLGWVDHTADGARTPVSCTVGKDGTWVAGDAYTLFVDLESVCSAKTRFLDSIEVSSKTIVKCVGNQSISDEDDFNNMWVHVRCP
jgi:hypothetical protein